MIDVDVDVDVDGDVDGDGAERSPSLRRGRWRRMGWRGTMRRNLAVCLRTRLVLGFVVLAVGPRIAKKRSPRMAGFA